MSYWEPTAQQIRAFSQWSPEFREVKGPLTLWNFSNRQALDDRQTAESWWMDKATVMRSVEQARTHSHAAMVFEFLRREVALRIDWGNRMSYAYELTVPAESSIHAWVGAAKAQQAHKSARKLKERADEGFPLVLAGGATQYLIRHHNVRGLIVGPIDTGGEPER